MRVKVVNIGNGVVVAAKEFTESVDKLTIAFHDPDGPEYNPNLEAAFELLLDGTWPGVMRNAIMKWKFLPGRRAVMLPYNKVRMEALMG